MYLKTRVLLLLFISSLTFFSCSDDPASIGGDTLPGEDFVDLLALSPDSVQYSSSFLKNKITQATSERVILGRANGNESSILLRFLMNTMPDTIETQFKNDQLNILNVRVDMVPKYTIGEGTYDFNVFRIANSWSSNVTADSLALMGIETGRDLSTNRKISDSLHSFELDTELVKTWLVSESDDTKPEHYGVYLYPTADTKMAVGYQARTSLSTDHFIMNVIIQKKDLTYQDTLVFAPTLDVHVVSGEVPQTTQEMMMMEGGLGINSILSIKLSTLPVYSRINRALLQLTRDASRTTVGNPTNDSLVVRFLVGALDTGVHYDSSSAGFVLMQRNDTKYEGDIAKFVQRWLNGETNYGILISLYNETRSLDQVVLFGPQAVNPADKPKLYVTYTAKK